MQSWNIGFQRALGDNTVIEARFTGNHGTDLWRQYNLNEVNIVENGFLNDFNIAANNLAIANGTTAQGLYTLASLKSTNFGNQGLPGQQNLSYIGSAHWQHDRRDDGEQSQIWSGRVPGQRHCNQCHTYGESAKG